MAPIQAEADWGEVKTFAKTIAGTMAKERPDRYVATMAKRARSARIFVDYLRNDRGATAVAAYSTRALPRASVSTPLNWKELSPGLRSDHFNVGNVLHRLSSLKRDPWQGFSRFANGYHSFNMSRDGSEHRLRDGLPYARKPRPQTVGTIKNAKRTLRPRPCGPLCSNFEFLHSVSNSFRGIDTLTQYKRSRSRFGLATTMASV